jgi:hypothetical protein
VKMTTKVLILRTRNLRLPQRRDVIYPQHRDSRIEPCIVYAQNLYRYRTFRDFYGT